jgi:stearoyl-CoA desaturase (delta-9 desaturase)
MRTIPLNADSAMETTAQASLPTARKRVFWLFLVIVAMHILLPLAFLPYTFAWWGIAVVLLGNFIFGSIGINLGYHRMLTHSAAKFPGPLERLWVLLGVCSMEGSPLFWVCTHRIHHQHSDGRDDPHSPRWSFFWGHLEWIYTEDPRRQSLETYSRYVPDLMGDKFLRWLHRGNKWLLVWACHVVALAALGYLAGFLIFSDSADAIQFGTRWLLWSVVVRTVYVWHITWLVNSAAHRWGYRNYKTGDNSTNNWFVALLTNGEGWHNNHHATPRACSQGHRWWELDLTYSFVRLLQCVGLAWDVAPVKVPAHIREKRDLEKPQLTEAVARDTA